MLPLLFLSLFVVATSPVVASIQSHDSLITGLVPSSGEEGVTDNLFESHLLRAPLLRKRRSQPAHHSRVTPIDGDNGDPKTRRFTRKSRGKRGDARMRIKKAHRRQQHQQPLIKILPLPAIKPLSIERIEMEGKHREAVNSSWAWTDDADELDEAEAYSNAMHGVGDEEEAKKRS